MPRFTVTMYQPVGGTVVEAEDEANARIAAFDDPDYAYAYDVLGPDIIIQVEEFDEDQEIPEGD